MESLLVDSRTICLPFETKEHCEQCMKEPNIFRQFLTEMDARHPELFPRGMAQGFTLHSFTRPSKKQGGFRMRRIELKKGSICQVRPSFMMPYLIAPTDEVEKALFLCNWKTPDAIPRYYVRAGDNAVISALAKGKSIDNAKFSKYRTFEYESIDENVDEFCSSRANPEQAFIEKELVCKFLDMLTDRELEVKDALQEIQECVRLDRIAKGIIHHFPGKVRARHSKEHARRLGLSVEKFQEIADDIYVNCLLWPIHASKHSKAVGFSHYPPLNQNGERGKDTPSLRSFSLSCNSVIQRPFRYDGIHIHTEHSGS